MNNAFSKTDSLALKGVAISIMMWHHCFLSGRFEDYTISFWPLAQSQVTNIASFFKICVSLFAFVSGFGLYLSYAKRERERESRWVYDRLVRTLSPFWFVVVLVWIVTTCVDNRPWTVYGFGDSALAGLWYMLLDFLGLSNFFGSAIFNDDWWYMSAAVVFVISVPLLFSLLEKVGGFCTLGVCVIIPRLAGEFPGGTNFWSFLPMFCVGMIFAKYGVIDKWEAFWTERKNPGLWKGLRCLFLVLALAVAYKLYYYIPKDKFWDVKWTLIPLALILFCRDVLCAIPALQKTLAFLGKHSANIFWVHSLIRAYYCRDFTYGMGHFVLIMLVLLGISLVLSMVIEFIKTKIKYDVWIKRIFKLEKPLPENIPIKG